jgi:hypothetical protein
MVMIREQFWRGNAHRKHALRALSRSGSKALAEERAARRRGRKYEAIKDALIALWEASDRVCGKRLVVMIPTLLPALERHGRLRLGEIERTGVLSVSAATIDRLLGDVKVAAAGGRRRRVGFYSAIRREVPIRTFNDWNDPPPGFCEIDMVAHGGTSVAGSFIQTLTMVDVATGWTELRSGDTVRARACSFECDQGRQGTLAANASHARPGGASGRDARGSD